MLKIEIDEEVFAYLQNEAIAFVEKPNDTLRRLFGISKSRNHTKRPVKSSTKKMRKTNLAELINAGLLIDGQRLFFHDYQGHQYSEYNVTLSKNSLIWNSSAYSMSDLAKILLKKHGYESDSVRGPLFWYTENGVSIKDLWKRYNTNQ